MSLSAYAVSGIGGGLPQMRENWEEYSLMYRLSGKAGEEAAEEEAERVARAQMDALEYLQSVEEIPQRYRSAGTEQLGFLYGLGTPEEQQEAFAQMEESPIYRQVQETALAGLGASEEAIARAASMTGGLRSGNIQDALAENAAQYQIAARQAGMGEYLGGLRNIAQLPTDPQGMAQAMTSPAETIASGQLAAARSREQGASNIAGLGMGLLAAFSDPSLKTNIEKVGELPNGLGWYKWDWSEDAKDIGLAGEGSGVMADEVKQFNPNLITEVNGYQVVNYEGVLNASRS